MLIETSAGVKLVLLDLHACLRKPSYAQLASQEAIVEGVMATCLIYWLASLTRVASPVPSALSCFVTYQAPMSLQIGLSVAPASMLHFSLACCHNTYARKFAMSQVSANVQQHLVRSCLQATNLHHLSKSNI